MFIRATKELSLQSTLKSIPIFLNKKVTSGYEANRIEVFLRGTIEPGENPSGIGVHSLFEVFIASEQVISTGLMDIFGSINQENLRSDFYSIIEGSTEHPASSIEAIPAETAQELPADATLGEALDAFCETVNCRACVDEEAGHIRIEPRCVEKCREKKVGKLIFGDLEEEHSDVKKILHENFTIRRKTHLGTHPHVYYIVGPTPKSTT